MTRLQYREGTLSDAPAMAKIRSTDMETESHWNRRISGYMNGTIHPQKALLPRVVYVALDGEKMAGFIAGHLTERLGCNGELEWIDTAPDYRRRGVASDLLIMLANWFAGKEATRVCVDVVEDNLPAQRFYRRHGAINLDAHWLFWEDISMVKEALIKL